MEKIHWLRAILNGLLAWFLALLLVMLPGMVYGTMKGFEMSRAGTDPDAQQTQIASEIVSLYEDNPWLSIVLIVIGGLIVSWRAHIVAKGTGAYVLHNALIVGGVPAAISLVFRLGGGPAVSTLLSAFTYLVAAGITAYMQMRHAESTARV